MCCISTACPVLGAYFDSVCPNATFRLDQQVATICNYTPFLSPWHTSAFWSSHFFSTRVHLCQLVPPQTILASSLFQTNS